MTKKTTKERTEETPEPTETNTIHPRILAHLGDAVYEVKIREMALKQGSSKLDDVHRYTTLRVKGEFQARLLHQLMEHLTEEEKDMARRGRNLPTTSKRRSDHAIHRQASAFEALIGHLHLTQPQRLHALWPFMMPFLEVPETLLKSAD